MNILMISTHLNTGGITSYLRTLTKGLIQGGHTVHLATSGGTVAKDFESLGAQLLELDIKTKSELSPKIYFALKPLKTYIRQNRIDIIHAHTRITQVMATLLSRSTHCPYVSTCHGYFKVRLSRKWAPCWGDAVIAISKAVSQHLSEDFRHDADKIHLIPSGIDLEEFKPEEHMAKMEHRKRFGLGDEPVLGMIARLSDVKGADVLVEAMPHVVRKVADVRLLLIGEGRMESSLRSQIKRLGLDQNIRLLTSVNRTREMLSLMDIFVMPSRQEGLGLSIMEAQAMGLPVVASRVGGIPSLIDHEQTGILVDPENPQALSEALIGLITHKQRRSDIGRAARESIMRHHSMDLMTRTTLDVYEKVLSDRQ